LTRRPSSRRYTRITGKTLDLSSAPMVQTAKE
jgi:hypothetical protein